MATFENSELGRGIKIVMKVAVCLPSFNESSNIQNITRIVDQGLTVFLSKRTNVEAVIVNVDSNSSDDTVLLFKETDTVTAKHSIVVTENGGKGKNILEFCRYVLSHNIDYCLTLDTDIVSAIPEWVTKLLTPLLEQNVLYVTPVYERSRFEGSSTNHFAFPLVYALSGKIVRQPIAGDFAFSRKLANAICNNDLVNTESIQKYGIDIFMTLMAVGMEDRVVEVNLGKKLHAPSFNKLEFMFPQIAASALLSSTKVTVGESEDIEYGSNNILQNLNFPHKEAAKEMKRRAQETLETQGVLGWTSDELVTKFVEATSADVLNEVEIVALWTTIMSDWLKRFRSQQLTPTVAEQAGQELLPFFVLRATSFWFWAETVDVDDVERAIRNQAELLRNKIQAI